jgi:gamma-aminobutyrate permease
MAVVMFSFGGVEMISLSAAEAKDPARSVASSVKAMIWRLSTFYVVSMAIILCLVPWQTAAQNSDLTESPFVMVFSEMGIPFAADIMNFVVLVAALSGANASLYAATRLMHALGADKMAPSVAARTTSRGVPMVALLISFTGVVVATVMAVAKIGNIFALLMALVTLCILIVWIMILLTYQAYKKDQGDASSFTVLGGRLTAGLALVGVLGTLVALFMLDGSGVQESIMVGVVFFVLISIGYVIASRRLGGFKRPDLDAMHEAEDLQARATES